MPLKDASRILNINYNSAKTIMNVYKKEGRIVKKVTRNRRSKNSPNKSCDTLFKRIFQIQRIETESLVEQLFTESSKGAEQEITPKFSFDIYSSRIINEYEERLKKRARKKRESIVNVYFECNKRLVDIFQS